MVFRIVPLSATLAGAEKVRRLLNLVQMEFEPFVDGPQLASGDSQIPLLAPDLLRLPPNVTIFVTDERFKLLLFPTKQFSKVTLS